MIPPKNHHLCLQFLVSGDPPDSIDGVLRAKGRVSTPVEVKLGKDVLAFQAAVEHTRSNQSIHLNLSCSERRSEGGLAVSIRMEGAVQRKGKYLRGSIACNGYVTKEETMFCGRTGCPCQPYIVSTVVGAGNH